MEGREGRHDENGTPECGSSTEENGDPIFGVSELKSELRNIAGNMPLILESPKSKSSRRKQNSCPCSTDLAYPYYINFISPSRDFLPFSADLEQPRYNHRRRQRIFYLASSLFNMPSNMRSLDLVIKSLRDRRKPSVTDLDDFVDESSSQASTEDSAAVSPSRMLIFESLEAALKVRALHKRSFVAPRTPKGRIVPFKRSTSESSYSEKTIQSRSSSTSVSSNLISTGLLCCMWKNGLPHFEFSVEDDPSEIYVANPLKVRSTVDKELDYIYVFQARKGSRFAAKMKVSSSLRLSSKESDCIETEFVLFDADGGLSAEMQRSSSSLTKTKGFSKKVAKMLTPSYSPKRKICHKAAKSCSQFNDIHEVIAGDFRGIDELVPPRLLTDDFPPNLELSAIVVKDYHHKSNGEFSAGGWGLKFLAKAEGGCMQNRRRSSRRVNVVIPSGVHGGPVTSSGGPSSLTERWKSGGLCDCGGWDVGCPITVLSDSTTVSETSPHKESQECNSIDLFMEVSFRVAYTAKVYNLNCAIFLVKIL